MKRAFDANVSRAKPKIGLNHGLAAVSEVDGHAPPLAPPPPREPELPLPHASTHRIAEQVVNELSVLPASAGRDHAEPLTPSENHAESEQEPVAAPTRVAFAAPQPRFSPEPSAAVEPPTPVGAARRAVAATPVAAEASSPQARRERLKERLKRASEPLSVRAPLPATPAEAEAASLTMIGALQQALEGSEAQATALRHDLEEVRGQLARAAAEARSRTEEAQTLAREAGERSKLMEDLTSELSALEAERDDSLQQLSQARAEIRSQSERIGELEQTLAAKDQELLESIAEEERFAADLETRSDEVRTLRGLTASLTTERDALLLQLGTLTRERAELSDARKALESVHQALSAARSRTAAHR